MKKAFTMLELIFVLVVVGILAVVITPRLERNPVYEAGVQLLSDIRYTQHLAMVDNKYDATDLNWFREKWQIMFENSANSNNQWAYTIYSDTNKDAQAQAAEIATNPQDQSKRLSGGTAAVAFQTAAYTPEMNLGTMFGITNVVVSGGGGAGAVGDPDNSNVILFDNLGRSFRHASDTLASVTDGLAVAPIFIKICEGACTANGQIAANDTELVIRIEDETGSPCILQQNTNNICMD